MHPTLLPSTIGFFPLLLEFFTLSLTPCCLVAAGPCLLYVHLGRTWPQQRHSLLFLLSLASPPPSYITCMTSAIYQAELGQFSIFNLFLFLSASPSRNSIFPDYCSCMDETSSVFLHIPLNRSLSDNIRPPILLIDRVCSPG